MRSAPLAVLALLGSALAQPDALSAVLATIPFTHTLPGTSQNGDAYYNHPLPCYYLEVENVTGFAKSWGGSCAVQALAAGGPPPSTQCSSQTPPHTGFDRPGSDLSMLVAPTAAQCADACCSDMGCLAWTHVNALTVASEGVCTQGQGCCWLKGSVPAENPNNYPGGIASGTVTRPPQAPMVVPPTGVRNAVPLGGLGAGTLELRGDGTFHEITIHSASPAGSAKYPTQGDMLLAVRVGSGAGAATRALRTAPPPYATGVAALTYSGVYPVSQLNVSDPALAAAGAADVSLYAYHHLSPGDSPASATPAVIFTLTATNAGPTPLPVSLFLSLPFGAMANCKRLGAGFPAPGSGATASAPACLAACAANASGCGAWNFDAGAGACTLLPAAGGMVYAPGATWCGVAGEGWSARGEDGSTLTLALNSTPGSAGSAAIGDVSLRAVGGSTLATAQAFSLGTADTSASLYSAFAAAGAFGGGLQVQAAVGGAIVSAVLPPGARVSQSLVLSWYFPNRDFYGRDIGQFYSTLFADSAGVAGGLGAEALLDVAGAAAAHTGVWAGAAVSHPSWLTDHMVNQFSHFRNFIYSRDGIMREHEANDVRGARARAFPFLQQRPTSTYPFSLFPLAPLALSCPALHSAQTWIPYVSELPPLLPHPAPPPGNASTNASPPPPLSLTRRQ